MLLPCWFSLRLIDKKFQEVVAVGCDDDVCCVFMGDQDRMDDGWYSLSFIPLVCTAYYVILADCEMKRCRRLPAFLQLASATTNSCHHNNKFRKP